jgi:hypothetical protein
VGLLNHLASLFRRPTAPQKASAHFDDAGVSCRWPDGDVQAVGWGDLCAVDIQTTDTGPFVEDVFLVLHGSVSSCVIPLEEIGSKEVLNRLKQLPGFDLEAFISAMTCTDNATFPCWRRAGE